MRRLAVATCFAGFSLVACSFIFDLPAQSAALTSDAGPGGGGGGGPGSGDAFASDGPADEDSPTIRRPPPPPFCASQTTPHLFCADFDDPTAPAASSAGTVQAQTGQVLVVDSVSFSPPRALIETVSGAGSRASIAHGLATVSAGLTISFEALVSKWQASSATIAEIDLTSADSTCDVQIVGAGTNWSVLQDCAADSGPATVTTDSGHPIDSGAWHRFVLSVKLDEPKKVTLDIDAVRVVDVGALDAFIAGQATATFGVDRVTGGSAVLFQDDLLITTP